MGALIREIHFSKRGGGALICGPLYFEKYGNLNILFVENFNRIMIKYKIDDYTDKDNNKNKREDKININKKK